MKHVNRYTGIALKDDPTIMGTIFFSLFSVSGAKIRVVIAWESGNELSGARFGDGPAPPSWTKEIGELVKNLAPKQLFGI